MTTPHPHHPSLPAHATDLPYRADVLARTLLADGVWQLRLTAPQPAHAGIASWAFTAGQYTVLGLPDHADLPLRPFSLASAPARPYVDLHIRDTGHGLSHAVAHHLQHGDTVALGQSAGASIPEQASARPLLLIAGGVGIAPIASILDARTHDASPCHLYWAVERAGDLYLDAEWKLRVNSGSLASYHALTADDTPQLRRGMAGPAVIADLPDLGPFAIYMAGPAAMVAATVPLLLGAGAQKEYIFGDGITL